MNPAPIGFMSINLTDFGNGQLYKIKTWYRLCSPGLNSIIIHGDETADRQTDKQTDRKIDKPVVIVARDAQCYTNLFLVTPTIAYTAALAHSKIINN